MREKMTYEVLVQEMRLVDPRIEASQMFGMPVLKVGKKAFAGSWQGCVVFKLLFGSDEHRHALALDGSKLFDPGMGKPMREWIQVKPSHSADWPSLARAAYKYVATVGDQG
jgi:hypothetical protein